MKHGIELTSCHKTNFYDFVNGNTFPLFKKGALKLNLL